MKEDIKNKEQVIKETIGSPQTLTESEMLSKLTRSREHATQGMYRDADEVMRDMQEKYRL